MARRCATTRFLAALLLALPPAAVAAFTSLTGVTASSSGENHTCAIAGGVAYCWGANSLGQLGNGTLADSPSPTAVSGLPSPVTAISAGQQHSCAIAGATNDVYCWGLNDSFQLGPTLSPNGCGTTANIPCAVTAQKSTPTASPNNTSGATAIAAGWYHTCAVISGAVKCWGLQGNGRLGDGINAFTNKAASAATVVANTTGATVVTGGTNWSCALVGTGVRCWGGNGSGNLGNGTFDDSTTAVQVSGITTAVGLAGGDSHACAVLSTGAMRCWGGNSFGQLGNNTSNSSEFPVAVTGLASGIATSAGAQIAAGASHTCAVVGGPANGSLKCWGRNDFQQSDSGGSQQVLVPPVVARIPSGVASVSVGAAHTCAVVGGSLQCFGRNVSGQLGTGFAAVASSALAATPLTDGVTKVSSGSLHACAVRGGQVFCWGYNSQGQLGNGSFLHSPTPVAVSGIASGATAVATGAAHSCAIVNGGVKCWGSNQNGQLGNNSTATSLTPVNVIVTPPSTLLANVTAIAAGTGHTCAVVDDGVNPKVWCWGANNTAQVGDNTTVTPRTVATPTTGASTAGAIAVAAGNNHTCAIVAGNALKCWGNNSAGQLGTSLAGNTLQAAFAGSLLSGVTGVAAGNGHTCAVQGGALKCFGNNGSGQLGDGSIVTPSPLGAVRTPVTTGATAVAGGFGHTCAVVNGGLKCWGDGTKGQLGNGSVASLLVPTDVPGLAADVSGVSAGSSHTCAIYGSGVTCFGFGEYGELGTPRYAFASTPAPVKVGFGSATSLLTNRNPSEAGQAVTLVATVALNASNPAPGGTVAFRDGGTPIANCGAVALVGTGTVRRATCTTTALPGGTRSLTADYAGDANYAASSSPAVSQLVQVTTPTAFGFTHQTGVAPGSMVTSNPATIAGINVTVPISVTGGLYSVGCTGTFTGAAGTISAGATVCVRHVTPLALGATTTTTVTVGGGSASFNSTTALSSPNTQPANLAAGISHNLAVTSNGQVWGWGDNTAGKLGNGNTTVSTIPVRAGTLAGVIAVAAGMGHSLALRSDGTVWAWGLDDQGQLGNGSTSPDTCEIDGSFGTFLCSLAPRQVTGLGNVVAISAGWRHSMALTRDGSVWTWGSDFYGQRGLGSNTANLPGRVTLAGTFTRISAGYMHSVALRSDGTVWAWGKGEAGELGVGATASTSTPRQVTGFTRAVTDISAGGSFTLARLDNNSLVAWGSNRYGTLGDFTAPTNNGAGVASFRATPAPIPNLINVVDFSAGTSHAVGLRSDGTVWSWGVNNRAQTGLATTSTTCGQQNNLPCVRDPLRVIPRDGAIRVLAGGAHTLTVRPGNALDIYGDNAVGQRGNTTGNFGQPLAPPTNLARFNQSVYEPDVSLTPGGAFGTPSGVGQGSAGGALSLDNLTDGLVFPPQGIGTASAPLVLSLNNVSATDAIAIASITVAGSAIASEFAAATTTCGASLAPGDSCTIDIVFSPAAFGARDGALTIASNAANSTALAYSLSGNGVDNRAPSTVSLGTTASTSAAGIPVTFTAGISAGGQSPTGTVTFLDNGVPIAGCTSVAVAGTNAFCTTGALAVGVHPISAEYSGNAQVQPSSSPVVFQTVISVATPAAIPRLGNISTRAQVLTGNDVMIGGFIIGGTDPKTVVVRARGPSLAPFGIPNFLANPKLDLFAGQAVIASNDDFGTAPNLAALQATGFAPTSAQESAILATLGPGAYTAIVTGVGNTTGVGIVEVFEVDRPDVPLANISTRGQVLTNNDVMIGGFIIQGDTPQTVIVRARGPSLAPFGIANFLANPVLQLFSGQTQIALNDNWQSAPNAAEVQSRGFAPTNAFESAILVTLSPGAYTAIVTGAGGGTGVGIIEVFAQ